jgi:hypothetical protein
MDGVRYTSHFTPTSQPPCWKGFLTAVLIGRQTREIFESGVKTLDPQVCTVILILVTYDEVNAF